MDADNNKPEARSARWRSLGSERRTGICEEDRGGRPRVQVLPDRRHLKQVSLPTAGSHLPTHQYRRGCDSRLARMHRMHGLRLESDQRVPKTQLTETVPSPSMTPLVGDSDHTWLARASSDISASSAGSGGTRRSCLRYRWAPSHSRWMINGLAASVDKSDEMADSRGRRVAIPNVAPCCPSRSPPTTLKAGISVGGRLPARERLPRLDAFCTLLRWANDACLTSKLSQLSPVGDRRSFRIR